jgi:hypothetical protein
MTAAKATALEQELRDAKAERDEAIRLLENAAALDRTTKTRLQTMEQALRRYGKHDSACGVQWYGQGPCNCGLAALTANQEGGE